MAKRKENPPKNEVRIREKDEDYFRQNDDPYVLPPELNMTIKDGFRFGIGFILAMLIFYVIVMIGLIIFLKVVKALR